jgi:hypothetical protein
MYERKRTASICWSPCEATPCRIIEGGFEMICRRTFVDGQSQAIALIRDGIAAKHLGELS